MSDAAGPESAGFYDRTRVSARLTAAGDFFLVSRIGTTGEPT